MAQRIAVLIANPQAPVLTEPLAREAAAAVGGKHGWLAEGVACEIALPSGDAAAQDGVLRAALAGQPVDVALVPAQRRRKRLLIADMDSTMIEQECIDELAAEVGRKDEVAAVTAAAMRGEIPFEQALRDRVATLRGLDAGVVDTAIRERIVLRAGGRELIATMRAADAHTMLISGGFTLFTERIAAMIGFDEHQANTLGVEDGRFSGTVGEPILGREAKLAALNRAVAERGLDPLDTMAVGDGANDLAMIEAAGLGVALHAKPAVAARAHARIDHGDLTALLYLQGYRREEFAAT